MNRLTKIFLLIVLVIFPVTVSAQLGGIKSLVVFGLQPLIGYLITLVVGIAVVAFFWGLVKFIFAQGSETAKVEAKRIMGWGLIALFVMISVWGIVNFMQRELLPGANFGPPPIPTL
jgi:hypothetical protein